MKIIGISGSPRKDGNTAYYVKTVLDRLAETGAETSFIQLPDFSISGCKACYKCVEAKKCVIQDDFGKLFEKMVEADGIVLGSPTYHASITPELKAVLDRAGFSGRWHVNEMKDKDENYQWGDTAFSRKVVAPITVARRAGHGFSFAQLLMWATVNDCIVAGSNYWNIGIAGKGGAIDAADDEEAKSTLLHLADNMNLIINRLNG